MRVATLPTPGDKLVRSSNTKKHVVKILICTNMIKRRNGDRYTDSIGHQVSLVVERAV